MTKLDELTRAAREASEVRGYQTDPDVVALRIERVRAWCDRLVWTGIIAGLLFTMANVQHFAAGDTAPPWQDGGSIDWVIAWLLDPMVSLVLIGVLMGEQVINRHGIKAGGWVRVTKWVALAATYAMNTWSSWSAGSPSGILLHSVPPVIVVCATEAIPTLRRQITEAVMKAYRAAYESAAAASEAAAPAAAVEPPAGPVVDPGTVTFESTPRFMADRAGQRSPAAPRQRSGGRLDARPNKGVKVPGSARKSAAALSPRAASDEELRARLDALTASGQIAADPSVRAVQTALGVSFTRAKRVMALGRADEAMPGQLTVLDAVAEADEEAA